MKSNGIIVAPTTNGKFKSKQRDLFWIDIIRFYLSRQKLRRRRCDETSSRREKSRRTFRFRTNVCNSGFSHGFNIWKRRRRWIWRPGEIFVRTFVEETEIFGSKFDEFHDKLKEFIDKMKSEHFSCFRFSIFVVRFTSLVFRDSTMETYLLQFIVRFGKFEKKSRRRRSVGRDDLFQFPERLVNFYLKTRLNFLSRSRSIGGNGFRWRCRLHFEERRWNGSLKNNKTDLFIELAFLTNFSCYASFRTIILWIWFIEEMETTWDSTNTLIIDSRTELSTSFLPVTLI